MSTLKKYTRILLKVSGEFFLGTQGHLDITRVQKLAQEILTLQQQEVQVAVVLGAGNFCRGRTLTQSGMDTITADHIGMLATIINALALKDVLLQHVVPVEVYSALGVQGVVAAYVRDDALSLLDNGFVVICAAGTGNPLVTTDSAAALRAIELGADILLKATKVDGVYASDPTAHPQAARFDHLTYDEVIAKSYQVMDLGAFCLCREHHMPIRIFNMEIPGIIARIVAGENEGTLIE